MLRDEIKLDTSDWFAVNEKIMSILKFIVKPIFFAYSEATTQRF